MPNNEGITFYILATLLGLLMVSIIPVLIFSNFNLLILSAALAGIGTFAVLVLGKFP